MTIKLRLLILFAGFTIACISAILVGYALWPLETGVQQATLPSTFFLPP